MSDVSPDVTAYADLRLYDRQPIDLINRAIADMSYKLPGWVYTETSIPAVLLEGLALEAAEEVYAINRLPGAITQVLLGLFGINQLPGAPPTATVTFSMADTTGYTIPLGTNLRIPAAVTGAGDVYFTTNANTSSSPGALLTAPVAITGASNTNVANALPAGTQLDILDPISAANTCQLATPVTAGALPETGLAFLSRGITALQSLNSTLVLAPQFVNYALANGAYQAFAEDNYDTNIPGASNGVISVAVIGQNGAVFSPAAMAALATQMNAVTQANLVVRVVAPSITAVNVTATVMTTAGQVAATVQAAVVAALDAYLSPNNWPFSGTVRVNKLLNVIETVPGVDYVVGNLTAPSSDVTLTGFAPLASAGTLNITVQTPA